MLQFFSNTYWNELLIDALSGPEAGHFSREAKVDQLGG